MSHPPASLLCVLAVQTLLMASADHSFRGATTTSTTTTTTLPECTPEQYAHRCSHCDRTSQKCTTCEPGYGVDSRGTCVAECMLPGYQRPSAPPPAIYLGVEWPEECPGKADGHFFAIGDWGGVQPGCPAPNWPRGPSVPQIDNHAQALVAGVMNARAKEVRPSFVLNAGDNFYWGGIPTHCGTAWKNKEMACHNGHFDGFFEAMYKGEGMDNVPWFSTLGNHDLGGFTYSTGWDLQMLRSFCNTRWRMPGPFWKQKVHFDTFSVEVFIIDTNWNDALAGNTAICGGHNGPTGTYCDVGPNATMANRKGCADRLRSWYDDGKAWVEKELKASTADWTIALTHYPPTYNRDLWKDLATHGLDLIITGHTHAQYLYRAGAEGIPTPWIISGGGGGITSQPAPDRQGHDAAYGFVDFSVNRTHLTIEMISHGGIEHKHYIITDSLTLRPRPKTTEIQLVEAMV